MLPFGLTLSLRVFVHCTEAAIAPLRCLDIRLATGRLAAACAAEAESRDMHFYCSFGSSLHIREFEVWVATLGLDPMPHGTRRVLVTHKCSSVLHYWQALSFLTQGVDMCTDLSRKGITLDASLVGRGSVYKGRLVRRTWSPILCHSHKLSGAFKVVSHPQTLPPVPKGPSRLGEDTTRVAYINRRGGAYAPVDRTCWHTDEVDPTSGSCGSDLGSFW